MDNEFDKKKIILSSPEMKKCIEQSARRLRRMIYAKAAEKNANRQNELVTISNAKLVTVIAAVGLCCYFLGLTQATAEKEDYPLVVYEEKIKVDPEFTADFALESAGAEIFGEPEASTYNIVQMEILSFHIPIWFSRSPNDGHRAVLRPGTNPGECWAFSGNHGSINIKLSHTIIPLAVTVDHVPKYLSPTGNINSAPRHFSVFALAMDDTAVKDFLGHFEFKETPPTQTFILEHPRNIKFPTRIVQFLFHSNQGNMEYTCVYKLRVHGTLFHL